MADFNLRMQKYHDGSAYGLWLYMFPYWMSYQNRRFWESHWPAFKQSSDKKGYMHIILDLIRLTAKWKCLPFHYFRYGLYNKKFSYKEQLSYLPETVFYYKILPRINKQMFILDDKNLFEEFLRGLGVQYPKTILKINKGIIFDENTNIIKSDAQLKYILKKAKAKRLFCKPSSWGSGGKGILSYELSNKHYLDDKGKKLNFKYLKEISKNDWIIQEGIQNDEEISKIYKYSVNSFRVLTYFMPEYGAKAIYCILKFGNNKAITDNAHTGGVYVRINMENGELFDTAYDEDLREYKFHPLTGHKFVGTKIKGVKKIIETAELLGNKLPNLTFIGWDIAITPTGPVVLEGNSSPGLTIIQRTYDGMSEFIKLIKNYEK